MESGSDAKTKRAYFPPTVTKLTSAQAEKLAADRTQCGHQGAADFLEALRREPRYERRWQREPEEVMHEGEGALVRRRRLSRTLRKTYCHRAYNWGERLSLLLSPSGPCARKIQRPNSSRNRLV
jgi:hypothetical protein